MRPGAISMILMIPERVPVIHEDMSLRLDHDSHIGTVDRFSRP